MPVLPEGDWSVELKKIRHESVEVIWNPRIRLNCRDTSGTEICLAPTPASRIAATPPGLIVDNPVPDGGLHLAQVRAWKMITVFWEIVVGRLSLGRENRFAHSIRRSSGNAGVPNPPNGIAVPKQRP